MVTLLSGCASLFNENRNRAEVIGPNGMTATDPNGNKLWIQHESDRQFLILPQYDTFVTFHYGYASKRVLLKRSYCPYTALDYFLFAPDLFIDDASGAWRQYDSIHVSIDSNGGVDTLLPTPSFWESDDRPRILLSFGVGYSNESTPSLFPAYNALAIGLSYRHKLELYYNSSGEVSNIYGLSSADTSPSVQIQSPIFRFYPLGNYFVEAGPSFLTIEMDTFKATSNADLSVGVPIASEHLTGITAGLGWCGDFSYVDIHYIFGFKPYQFFNLPAQQFRELVLSFGLVFRL
jgi:hypothetical protein